MKYSMTELLDQNKLPADLQLHLDNDTFDVISVKRSGFQVEVSIKQSLAKYSIPLSAKFFTIKEEKK